MRFDGFDQIDKNPSGGGYHDFIERSGASIGNLCGGQANYAGAVDRGGGRHGCRFRLPDFRGPKGFWEAYPPFRENCSPKFQRRIGSSLREDLAQNTAMHIGQTAFNSVVID